MVSSKENTLLDLLSREGVTVLEAELDGAWGYYDHAAKTIYLQSGMTSGHRLATLAHETHHCQRGDLGPQSQVIEDRINEEVALALIDPVDYAWAESQVGYHTGGLAALLDVPKWTVRAYRRVLARRLAA
ncbi:DUF6782 family putative metallopeptidase [Actinomycetaceae bacterium MB13-C1-2]|nr:DUF6782 family putative metallopeptidase [Actinomycetaceae bacterium MB13-C1-2]